VGHPQATPGRRRVIKKVQGGGHHGGAWKIAYADFMTAMMMLFLVLWLLASTDQKSREEIARYFRTGILPDAEMAMSGGAQYVPSVIERSPAPPRPESSIGDQATSVRAAIDKLVTNEVGLAELASKVRVQATSEGVLIEVADDGDALLFDTASSRLKPPLELFLRDLGPVLAARKEPIEIQGHTDARPYVSGAGKTNWDLSYERAAAARVIFEANGVKAERIVGVIGRGAAMPLDRDPYAARNRRLSVLLRMEPASVPAGEGAGAGAAPGAGEGADAGSGASAPAAGSGASAPTGSGGTPLSGPSALFEMASPN
jgi:chemotaxis protein MotB